MTSKYSQVVRHLNQESKNTKSIVLLANMVKLQPGELLLILISLLVTIMVLDGLTHTLVTLLGMVYPMFMTFKVHIHPRSPSGTIMQKKGTSG